MRKIGLGVSLCTVVAAFPVQAQDAASGTAAAQAGTSVDGIADIVVTAQRRQENLQRAALAVTAIDGSALANSGVAQPQDLSKLVPALKLSTSGAGSVQVTIRGVGNFAGNPYAEPAVAMNLDGVYLARSSGPNGLFYDLARVEVLKGPQGTIYGRNATAGAINIITRKPDDQLSAEGQLTLGNYGLVRGELALNAPLSTDAAFRVSGVLTRRGGYLSDGYLDDKSEAVRGQLKLKPTGNVSILLSTDYAHIGGKGGGGVISPFLDSDHPYLGASKDGSNNILTGASLTISGGTNPNLLPKFRDDGFTNLKNWGASATVDWDLGAATLTFIPAYRHNIADYLHYAAGFPVSAHENSRATSLETRLASRGNGPLKWLIGGYFFNEDLDFDLFANQGVSFNRTIPILNTQSFAAFGQLTYAVAESFRLTGGLRYTDEHKSQTGRNGGPPPSVPTGFPGSAAQFYQVACAPYDAATGTCYAALDGRLKQNKLTWKAGAEFDAGARSLVYANVATGFKAGGFFGSLAPNTYRPETITAYTLGSKNRFADNRLQLNLEAFYWRYKDKQVTHLGPILPGGFNLITENAGSADIYGAEVELLWQPSTKDRLSATAQYLHTEYGSFHYRQTTVTGSPVTACPTTPVVGSPTVTVDCSGRPLSQSPKWTLNASYTRGFDLAGGARIDAQIGTQIQSAYWVGEEYLAGERQSASMVSNANLTWRAPGGRFTASAFIDNIENRAVRSSSFAQPVIGVPIVTLRPPRTFGVRLGFAFR